MEEAPVAQEQQEQMEVAAGEGEAGGPIPLAALQVGLAASASPPLFFLFSRRRAPRATARCNGEGRGDRTSGSPFFAVFFGARALPPIAPSAAEDLCAGLSLPSGVPPSQ